MGATSVEIGGGDMGLGCVDFFALAMHLRGRGVNYLIVWCEQLHSYLVSLGFILLMSIWNRSRPVCHWGLFWCNVFWWSSLS